MEYILFYGVSGIFFILILVILYRLEKCLLGVREAEVSLGASQEVTEVVNNSAFVEYQRRDDISPPPLFCEFDSSEFDEHPPVYSTDDVRHSPPLSPATMRNLLSNMINSSNELGAALQEDALSDIYNEDHQVVRNYVTNMRLFPPTYEEAMRYKFAVEHEHSD